MRTLPTSPSGLLLWKRPTIPPTTKSSPTRNATSKCRCRAYRHLDRRPASGTRVETERGRLGRLFAVELGESLVDPVAAIVATPDPADHELPVDRAARHDHGPEVPDFGPARLRMSGSGVAIERHDAEL